MLIALMGDNCVGKSSVAERLQHALRARAFSGRDYLRLEKNEQTARASFQKMLADAVSDENIIYVISEKEQLALLPEGCVRVLVTASLESIRQRFAERMHGNLPAPVAAMLERKYGQFESEAHDVRIDTETLSPQDACDRILQYAAQTGRMAK